MAIDYKDIGQRIKKIRIERGYTQEKLSEMIGVGASHMSHIEGGKTIPSMEVFINLCNVLECSSDELLCRESKTAKPILGHWLGSLVSDCNDEEMKILTDILVAAKHTIRKNRKTE